MKDEPQKPLIDRSTLNLKGNSHISKLDIAKKDETKVVKKVIKGKVVQKKKTLGKAFAETFLGAEAKSVADYVFQDVLIPALKTTISEMFTTGVDMMLFGETRSSKKKRGPGGNSVVSYSSYYKDKDKPERQKVRSLRGVDDIILGNRPDAEEVLSNLLDHIEDYEEVSIGDLYDMIGAESSFTDRKYGWKNLSEAKVVRVRDGYLLDLPRVIELD